MSDVSHDGAEADFDAAEYVLGTLDRNERAVFEQRLQQDSGLAAAVARWDLRFAELADYIEPILPPSSVWANIERALWPRRLTVIDGGGRGAIAATKTLQVSRDRWRASAFVFGATAAALAIFIMYGLVTRPEGDNDSYVAAVNQGGNKPALVVRVDLKARRIFVRPVSAEAPAGRSLELWYIDAGEAPRSVGVIGASPAAMPMPNDAKGNDVTFAVSVEPPGGSKTGGPTGPVVYSGQLVKD